ncbi:thiol-activated cytolysin family protein [Flavobacterium oreochromis]|uniref:thiol-activated cytolysin family protein n=1 Tax=Flavobacterium oreochromis TaxID=2906078 RepID=UPI000B4D8E00|nr:thiol-activated cytolysin family protein [Flavobacterium oreochromis]OWP75454.1 thiol-activated cytolysin [Flavobacterium oreochromis]
MNFVRLNAKLLLLIVMQMSVLSCNKENIATNELDKGENTLSNKSIYDGPKTELEISKKYLSILSKEINNPNCQIIQEDYTKTFGDFSRLGTGAHLMWPGNLIQGSTILTAELGTIPVGTNGRNPIEVKVDAFSSNSSSPSSLVVEDPTAGKVQGALEKIIEGYYTAGTKFPANYSIDIQRTFNSKQLQLALNVGYTGADGIGLSAGFGLSFKKNKTYYAVTLKQKFFNVSVYPKPGLQSDFGWIKKEYPKSELDNYISENNPAAYISTVTYGRLYALVYESDENSFELEQALNFAYKNPTAKITAEQKLKFSNILENTRVYVKQLGGNATSGLESSLGAFAGNFDLVRGFIIKGAEVSKENPGYPIEYTAVNIGSNLPVTIKVNAPVSYSECKNSLYTTNTIEEARKAVEKLKSEYGVANCAKIIIFNNTDKEIILKNYTPWYESYFYNTPPRSIPAKKCGYVLAVHKTGASTGTFNQISYTLDDKTLSFGTYAPWNQLRTNNVLVDFTEITESKLYNNSVRPSIEKLQDNIIIRGTIDTGDAPYVNFVINN